MEILEVNFIAVLGAAVIQYVFSSIWYMPSVFGNVWAEGHGYRKQDLKVTRNQLAGGFAVSFLTALVFAHLLNACYIEEWQAGAEFGFYIWLGFGATQLFSTYLWTKQKFSVFLINSGNLLISLVFFGVFLTFWE